MPPPANRPASDRRIVSLDVLRGLAILLMILSGLVPKTLPNWMDHGYQPHYKPDAAGNWVSVLTPTGSAVFDGNWRGFTWVDLVFPMFLFAMGAAIPQAIERRRAAEASTTSLILGIVARWAMLLSFALLVDQLAAWRLYGQSETTRNLLAIVCFGLAFLFFVRWPRKTKRWIVLTARIGSAVAMIAIIILSALKPGRTFDWSQTNIIIKLLAHTYLVVAIACVLIPRLPWIRAAILLPVAFVAHYLALGTPLSRTGWHWLGEWTWLRELAWNAKQLLNLNRLLPGDAVGYPVFDFAPLFDFTWLKFLWIVIAGQIVGEWLVRWSRQPAHGSTRPSRVPLYLALALCIATFIGLRNYGQTTLTLGGPLRTPWIVLPLVIVALIALLRDGYRRLHGALWINRNLLLFGSITFALGIVLSCLPIAGGGFFEGGITKGPPATLSYYFTSVGLCVLLLHGLIYACDVTHDRRDKPGLIEANGQNPLMAYYLAHAVLGALLGLLMIPRTSSPWLGALAAILETLAIAVFVWLLTRRRIFWRA